LYGAVLINGYQPEQPVSVTRPGERSAKLIKRCADAYMYYTVSAPDRRGTFRVTGFSVGSIDHPRDRSSGQRERFSEGVSGQRWALILLRTGHASDMPREREVRNRSEGGLLLAVFLEGF
jgi:hypothetical protein